VIKVEGEATPAGDRAEWRGVTAALGAAAATTPVCALKGAWGHQGAAAGVTELAAMALGLRRGVVLPTRNFTAPDPDLAVMVAREPTRPPRLRCALVLSRGFGGQSAAIVLRAVADGTRAEETP
jgi:3-oxoacyl-(acyl-carrier-protein) synthase